jgi:methionine aminopeptidase
MPSFCAEPQQFNPDLEPFPVRGDPLKRAVLYLRVSTVDRQNPETQGIEPRQFATQRGFEIVQEYADHGISGTKIRRPALVQLLKDAHRRKFHAVLVWSCDRLARSTKHFLQVLDELNELGIQFHSQREATRLRSISEWAKSNRQSRSSSRSRGPLNWALSTRSMSHGMSH